MGDNSQVRIEEYPNIVESHRVINGWTDPALLPIEKLDDDSKRLLLGYSCIEVCFDRETSQGIPELFDELYRFYRSVLERLSLNTLLFTADFKPKLRGKVRSYKGIVPKSLKSVPFVQYERDLDQKCSVFGALLQFNSPSDFSHDAFEIFTDSATSFILVTTKDYPLSNEIVNDMIDTFMTHGARSVVNYVKVILALCTDQNLIFRIGGDGGVGYVSIQVFFSSSRLMFVREQLQMAISAIFSK